MQPLHRERPDEKAAISRDKRLLIPLSAGASYGRRKLARAGTS
jgi:hypothetical protein